MEDNRIRRAKKCPCCNSYGYCKYRGTVARIVVWRAPEEDKPTLKFEGGFQSETDHGG